MSKIKVVVLDSIHQHEIDSRESTDITSMEQFKLFVTGIKMGLVDLYKDGKRIKSAVHISTISIADLC